MKSLPLIFLLIFCTNVFADWVLLTRNHYGDSFWYEKKGIIKKRDNVWVWLRTRYPEATKYGHISDKSYFKINCDKYYFQLMSSTYYTDDNWTKEALSEKTTTEKKKIPPKSMMEMLAKIVCNR